MNPEIKLYFDYDPDGSKRPVWLSLKFGFDGIPWNHSTYEINISNYEEEDVYSFYDDFLGCSVLLDELLAPPSENILLVDLKALYERLVSKGADPATIERLMFLVSDIVEVGAIGKEMV